MPKAKKRNKKLEWTPANDVKKDIKQIVGVLGLSYINLSRVFCFRTCGSKQRAYARAWMMPKIFQKALNIEPAYVIEVLSEHYDELNEDLKKKVLIHELLHIPKNFSGALVPHQTIHRHLQSQVNELFKEYKKRS